MSRHPSRAWIEEYVMGILGHAASAELEAHVETCAGCAERLAAEARFELAMDLVAQGIGKMPPAPRLVYANAEPGRGLVYAKAEPARRLRALGAALAMAAVMLLFVGRASSEPEPAQSLSPAPLVSLDGDITVRPAENVDGG